MSRRSPADGAGRRGVSERHEEFSGGLAVHTGFVDGGQWPAARHHGGARDLLTPCPPANHAPTPPPGNVLTPELRSAHGPREEPGPPPASRSEDAEQPRDAGRPLTRL